MECTNFLINIRNILISVCYLFVVYLSELLITWGYIATKFRAANGDEFKTWKEIPLWANMRCYAGVKFGGIEKATNFFYKLVGFPAEIGVSSCWLLVQARNRITSVILTCFCVSHSVLVKTSCEFKFLQTSDGIEFIKLGHDLYWIDIVWSS
jgi:hypothetical protein